MREIVQEVDEDSEAAVVAAVEGEGEARESRQRGLVALDG